MGDGAISAHSPWRSETPAADRSMAPVGAVLHDAAPAERVSFLRHARDYAPPTTATRTAARAAGPNHPSACHRSMAWSVAWLTPRFPKGIAFQEGPADCYPTAMVELAECRCPAAYQKAAWQAAIAAGNPLLPLRELPRQRELAEARLAPRLPPARARRAGSQAKEHRVDECRPASALAASSASAASGFHTSPTSRDWGSTSHRRNTPAVTADRSTADRRRNAPPHVNVRTTIAAPNCLSVIMTASLSINMGLIHCCSGPRPSTLSPRLERT